MKEWYEHILVGLKTVAYCVVVGTIILIYKAQDNNVNRQTFLNQNEPLQHKTTPKSSPTDYISIIELQEILSNSQGSNLIVDARDGYFFNQGHIPTAVNMPLEDFNKNLKNYLELLSQYSNEQTNGKQKWIIVYCSHLHCKDSEKLKQLMEAKGIKNIRVFKGGYEQWEELQKTLGTKS